MTRFKTKVIDEYYASNEILRFMEYCETYPHEIGRYDGSVSIYYACKCLASIDYAIQKYGESQTFYRHTFNYAKKLMRNILKEIQRWRKLKGIDKEKV